MTGTETDQIGQELRRIATIDRDGSLCPAVGNVMPNVDVFLYEGIVLCAAYRKGYFSNLLAKLLIRFEDVTKLSSIPKLPHDDCYIEEIDVVKDGEAIFTTYSGNLGMLLHRHSRYEVDLRKKQTHERLTEKLDALHARLSNYRRDGLPVFTADQLYLGAASRVDRFDWSWQPISPDGAMSALKALERELDRLSNTDPTELIISALMDGDGSVAPHVLRFNKAVIDAVEQFTIRSAEQYGPGITDSVLYEHYADRLGGITSVHQLDGLDLKLDSSDFIISDDPDLAPARVELIGRKGKAEICEVVYSYYADGRNNKRRCGAITVSHDAFKRCCAEYGKKHSFPELQHGYDEQLEELRTYRLWLNVSIGNGKLVSGWADDIELVNRVEKRKKGLARKADELGAEAPTAPPPWAAGQAAKGSRRR